MDLNEAIAIALEYLDLAHGHATDDNEGMESDLREAMQTLEKHLEKDTAAKP